MLGFGVLAYKMRARRAPPSLHPAWLAAQGRVRVFVREPAHRMRACSVATSVPPGVGLWTSEDARPTLGRASCRP